jgi:arylsulfatase A-like enzyme
VTSSGRAEAVVSGLVDSAAIVLAWAALLLGENVTVGFLWRTQFNAAWELSLARHTVVPMALAALAPLSGVAVAGWVVAKKAAGGDPLSTRILAVAGALSAGAVAAGVTGGRHFASWLVRAPFVVALAAVGWWVGAQVAPRIAGLGRFPIRLASFGLVLTAGAWLADGYLLPRLYPGFHAAMLGGSLTGAALMGIALRGSSAPTRVETALAVLMGLIVASCAVWTPHAARLLERASNVRIALVEHAPLLGRAVIVAAKIHPANADDARPSDSTASVPPSEVARSLDWAGHDVLLLTVDALRADHLSSYGYARATTPNIDGLAREGALFEHAYCPTPHTSYSVTSMLTGKYLRPLLALGMGEDSETWPQALRRYGWRTAAFYPPAVFFIDEDRFRRFEEEHLGFEYAKVEFADPALREQQVREYLERAAPHGPLFLWVHLFEPHEPYVVHPEHVFRGGASPDIDAYDSEIAEDDEGIGRIARLVRSRRPGTVVIVTADHGEEFGEHGGHYHGTTVYEEQVRVPMVVVGPGVTAGRRVVSVVETIDLLPTVLSALGMPRPARLRGRDVGPLLTGNAVRADDGFAFAETDDYALAASGDERLVCERRAAACALYRLKDDPGEQRDIAGDRPERAAALRATLRTVERDHGRYEVSETPAWPEALRRGMQGEADVALDVASLLDDADVAIRRKAAEVSFQLHVPTMAASVRRSLARDEDDEVRRWSALALARMEEPPAVVDTLLRDSNRDWRRRAALVLAEHGEGRGCDEIAASWLEALPTSDGEPLRITLDLAHAEELLGAISKARCRKAVPALVRALEDVRVRPFVADTLGAIGDDRARGPLLALLAADHHVTARPHEARALLALGARDWSAPTPAPIVKTRLALPARGAPVRLLLLLSDAGASLEARADDVPLPADVPGEEVRAFDLTARGPGSVELDLRASRGGLVAAWLVPAGRLD